MPPIPVIPDHTLRRPIGRGAYGEVWLARNVMGTPRAVKIVWRRQFESDRPYERELAGIESYEPVSRSADGLVHVLHVGRNDAEGYFYYVMELADAADPSCEERTGTGAEHSRPDVTPLSAYALRTLRSDFGRVGRLPTADCLRLGLDVASGLAQLHSRGLIHRDVKPANIIYVNGRAKLADFGLVSVGGDERTFVGTEGYIPPEGPGSASSDLYALGIVLYEASTGHTPDRFPDVPPEWFAEGSGDEALELHEVVLKACEGQRENRYANVEALQADLALLQSGQSIRRVRGLERRLARLKALGIAAALTTFLAIGWVAFANYRAREAAERRAKETELRERAEAAERSATDRLHGALGALHAAAYLGGGIPNSPCVNYLGDSGAATPSAHPPFSFRVPAGSNFVVVVSTRTADIGCDSYWVELFGLPCPPPRLDIARAGTPGNVLLQWSTAYPEWRLQSVGDLGGKTLFADGPEARTAAVSDGKFTVTNRTVFPAQFHRLSR